MLHYLVELPCREETESLDGLEQPCLCSIGTPWNPLPTAACETSCASTAVSFAVEDPGASCSAAVCTSFGSVKQGIASEPCPSQKGQKVWVFTEVLPPAIAGSSSETCTAFVRLCIALVWVLLGGGQGVGAASVVCICRPSHGGQPPLLPAV
jgi:hypothetical protein